MRERERELERHVFSRRARERVDYFPHHIDMELSLMRDREQNPTRLGGGVNRVFPRDECGGGGAVWGAMYCADKQYAE